MSAPGFLSVNKFSGDIFFVVVPHILCSKSALKHAVHGNSFIVRSQLNLSIVWSLTTNVVQPLHFQLALHRNCLRIWNLE